MNNKYEVQLNGNSIRYSILFQCENLITNWLLKVSHEDTGNLLHVPSRARTHTHIHTHTRTHTRTHTHTHTTDAFHELLTFVIRHNY